MAGAGDKAAQSAPAPPRPTPAPAASKKPGSQGAAGGNALAGQEAEEAPPITAPIDLQNQAELPIAPELAEYIRTRKGRTARIPVKFGNVAKAGGVIEVKSNSKGTKFDTVDRKGEVASIPIDHPFFAPFASVEPHLRIKIDDNKIKGYAGPKATLKAADSLGKLLMSSPAELGLLGFDLKSARPKFENTIDAGVFKLGTKDDIDVKLAGWVTMKLGLGLENDAVRFSATGKVSVKGLADADLNMTRDPKGVVTGTAELAVNLSKFSGKAKAVYVNGDVSVTGTLGYTTEKLRGSLTLVVMDAAEAEKAARAQIDPENLVTETTSDAGAESPEKFKKGERGVAGWGELDFAFTDWFTGKARAIFGPAGYITIIGKIAPPASVPLIDEHAYNTKLFGLDLTARYGVPYVADIHVGIGIHLGATARIGPGLLTDIVVEGVYSTDPMVLNAFSITGAFRISAYAGLTLRFEGKAGLTVLGHDVDLGAGVTGKAGVKGYAEAKPTLGYREKADPTVGKKGEYFLKGHLEIAAQPFVGLEGELFVRLDSPWWSPAPDKTWTWPLFSLEYPLPGEFGIGADVDYVIGSGKMPDIKWGKADFDSSKFTDSLLDDNIPKKTVGGDVAKAGTFKNETPPPPLAPPPSPGTNAKAPGAAGPKAGKASAVASKGGGQKADEAANVPQSPETAKRWLEGMKALGELHDFAEKDPETAEEINMHLDAIKKKHGFTSLIAQLEGEYWIIEAELNPKTKGAKKPKPKVKAAKGAAPGSAKPTSTPATVPPKGTTGKKPLLPNEGNVGTYSSLAVSKDDQTPHHSPANRYMKDLGISGYSHGKGIAISMWNPVATAPDYTKGRHYRTRTFGSKACDHKDDPLDELREDIKDIKKVYDDDGLLSQVSSKIDQLEALNKSTWPNVFIDKPAPKKAKATK
jgi:hypothetical protein